MGMVGSINAPTSGNNTHDAFVAAAKAIGTSEVTVSFQLYEYQVRLLTNSKEMDDGNPVLTGVGATAVGPPTSSGSASGAVKTTAKGSLYLIIVGVIVYLN